MISFNLEVKMEYTELDFIDARAYIEKHYGDAMKAVEAVKAGNAQEHEALLFQEVINAVKKEREVPVYTWMADPGHAWLKVPLSAISKLGVCKQITHYSYVHGTDAYLEEDCDAPRFIKAAEAAGWDFRCTEEFVNHDSPIRGYHHWKA
jgi:hypothetical protein